MECQRTCEFLKADAGSIPSHVTHKPLCYKELAQRQHDWLSGYGSMNLTNGHTLFVAQSDHGIDAHGATGGDVNGRERDEQERSGDNGERERVVRGNAEKLGGHDGGERERARYADGDAKQSEFHAAGHDPAEDVEGTRA